MRLIRLKTMTFLVMIGAYLLVLFYWTITASIFKSFKNWEKNNEITLYLNQDILSGEEVHLEKEIRKIGDFKIKFFNQSAALDYFNEQFKLGPLFKNFENELKEIVPAFFILEPVGEINEIEKVDLIVKLKNLVGIEDVTNHEMFIGGFNKLKTWLHWAFWISLAFVVLLISFIVSNVLKSELNRRIKELKVLLLLGATPWMIQKPFLKQGVMASIGAVVTAIVFLNLIQKIYFLNFSKNFALTGTGFYLYQLTLVDYFGIVLVAILIGFLGTVSALKEIEIKET